MPWLSVLSGVLKLGSVLAEWCKNKGLMDAGEAKGIAKSNAASMAAVERAMAARRGVDHSAGSVSDDEFNRDK